MSEGEAAARGPSRFARFVSGPFWAGLLGLGVGLWLGGIVALLDQQDALPRFDDGHSARAWSYLAAGLAGVVASFGLGYRSGLRSYPELFARLLLAPLWALLGASIVGSMVSAFTRGRTPAFLALLASGVVLTALITAHLHRPWVRALRVPGRTRRRVVAGLSVALLVTSFGLSSKLRCRLGNAVSCRDAAGNENDPEATAWFERGCEGGDALLCEHLADRYREGRGVPKDLKKAEEHLVDACAMGLDSACAGVEEMALVGGCDRYDLTSCRRLAAARPNDAAVTRKACLLGDEGACRRGGGR